MNNKNDELKNLVEQTKKKEKIKKEKIHVKWVLLIVGIAFLLSFLLSAIANLLIPNLSLIFGITLILLFIFLNILLDTIGVAVTVADEAVFHSMNSRRVKGASLAVRFKKNADRVSTFCCDVVGDVCGVISGSAGTAITAILVNDFHTNLLFTGLFVTAIISSLTIGGKAIGKSIAINKSDIILYEFAKVLSIFYPSGR